MNFVIIQENKAENLFMLLDELFLVFQINFHLHNFFNDLQIFTFKIAWWINEWQMLYYFVIFSAWQYYMTSYDEVKPIRWQNVNLNLSFN